MKIRVFIVLISILSITVSAQNVKKGYKSLEKKDYVKAKEAFEKNLLEFPDHVASNFGMALMLSDEKSPYFNIVDSWAYMEKVIDKTNELNQEELETISEFFTETEDRKTSRPVKKKIDIAIETIENNLIKYIREENDLEATYKVLENYPNFKFYDNVVHIRNQFEYRKYEKINTFEAYDEFVNKFPDAAQINKAKRNRDKFAFDKAMAENTVLSYNTFIKNYPESEELPHVIKLRNEAAFKEAEAKNTLAAYESFVSLYPDALQIPEAKKQLRDLLYEKAKKVKSLEAYNDFIRLYPDGGYFVDVFNLKAEALGKKALAESGFGSAGLKWVRALDNKEQLDLGNTIAITNDNGYVIAGTTQINDTAPTDAWILKLDSEGKVIWNKTIGQSYNDIIDKVYITSDNNIICVGRTQVNNVNAPFVSWIFMLSQDGSKLWNKNLGSLYTATSNLSPADKLYLATYKSDTLSNNNLYIQALNQAGQKVWDRKYTRKGVFKGIGFTSDKNVILAGGNWITYNDPKLYISWEDTLNFPGTVTMMANNDSYINMISKDSVAYTLVNYNIKGENISQTMVINESAKKIDAIQISPQNNVLVGLSEANTGIIKKFSVSGSEINSLELKPGYKVIAAIRNNSGGMTYLLKSDDFIILSYSTEGF